ncbi:MFS domain-containing protein [Fusarium keratoplasticum]|nr:MFS domain-containing protein [Fusarium keratoplasticum]
MTEVQGQSSEGYVPLVEAQPDGTHHEVVVKPVQTWKGYIWDTWELPPDQRRLLFKVDAFILTFASIGYFLKNIDQTNVNNAFLSGMEEDLEMYGNQLVTTGSIGSMFSGFLQAAAYTNLDGVHGRAGWRWLFIIDGIITLPLAVAGYFFFPNLPQDGKRTWWTTEDEHILSVKRMQAIGRAGKQPWTRAKVKKTLRSWHTYHLPLLYILWNNGNPQAAMGYWLKSFNAQPPPMPGKSFSVPEINSLPIPTTAIFILMALAWAWTSDGPLQGKRWPFIYAGAALTLIFNLLFLSMPLYSDIDSRMVVYWLSHIGHGAGPLILSWINEICSADTEKRALLVAVANDLAYVVQAIVPNFMWKTTDFPAARKGYTYSSILQVLLLLETAIIQLLLWRDRRQELRSRIADSPPPLIYSDEEEQTGGSKAPEDEEMNDETSL